MGWKLEVYTLLLGCKKENIYIYIYISRWILYLILSRLKWVVSHSHQPNTTRLLSVLSGFGSSQPVLLIGRVRVEGSLYDY